MAKEVTVTIKQILHPKNLATCLSEIVKYVLYTKSQIPLPYDQLVKDKPLQEQTQKAAASLQEDGDRKPPVIHGQAKRLQDRVKKLQQHIACIQSTCLDAGSSIQEMVVILGATLMSPKEVYRVKIESGLVTGSAAVLAQDNLTRYVVRSLVSIGLEANAHSISPTNCFVLFFAPRLSKFGTAAFPRMSFKVVPRGSHVRLHLNLDSSINSKDGNYCQVTQDPEQSGRRVKIGDRLADKQTVCKEETVTEAKLDLPCLMEGLSLDEGEGQKDDYIWFQLTTVFQGFRELPAKSVCKENWSEAGNSDIWA